MTLDDFTALLEAPTSVDAGQISALRNMLRYAPYCAPARLLLIKALYDADDPTYADEMEKGILVAPPEVSVYFLLNPKKIKRKPQPIKKPEAPSYFDMLEHMQRVAQQSGLPFEELTRRYMEIRQYTA